MKGLLLDVEGTTTPIRFVTEVLFPYARAHFEAFVRSRLDDAELRAEWDGLRAEASGDADVGQRLPEWSDASREARVASLVGYAHSLMDRDRKSTALKSVQGRIWQQGYGNGTLRGEVFDDVPEAFRRWADSGIELRIYSSGSVLAQRLLFSTVASGDLTPYLRGYFDTTTGAKHDPRSYARIAETFGRPASELVFVSDVTAELDAAAAAGWATVLSVRPGNPPQPPHTHRVAESFAAI